MLRLRVKLALRCVFRHDGCRRQHTRAPMHPCTRAPMHHTGWSYAPRGPGVSAPPPADLRSPRALLCTCSYPRGLHYLSATSLVLYHQACTLSCGAMHAVCAPRACHPAWRQTLCGPNFEPSCERRDTTYNISVQVQVAPSLRRERASPQPSSAQLARACRWFKALYEKLAPCYEPQLTNVRMLSPMISPNRITTSRKTADVQTANGNGEILATHQSDRLSVSPAPGGCRV